MALLGRFAGIDLRRPASWIACASGLFVGWWFAVWTTADDSIVGSMAMLLTAVAVVAAIGEPPADLCRPTGRSSFGAWLLVWAAERAAWPLFGVALGMAVAGGYPAATGSLVMAALGAVLAVVTMVVSRLSGAKAADAASLTLVMAAASAAAGVAIDLRLAVVHWGAVAVWLLLGLLAWAWSQALAANTDAVPTAMNPAEYRGGGDVLHLDVLPAAGRLRQTLTMVAMGTALLAMAAWLVLDPAPEDIGVGARDPVAEGGGALPLVQTAVAWAFFSAAWFIGLAVPQATLQDGIAGATGWERLFRTAAGPAAGGLGLRRFIRIPRIGPGRFAGGVALTQAAILGWPAVVCTVLSLPTPAGARLPLGIVVGLGLMAAIVTGSVALGVVAKASRETRFAATLAIVVAIVASTLMTASLFSGDEQPASPSLPNLVPQLLQWPGSGELGKLVLLQTAPSCQTS